MEDEVGKYKSKAHKINDGLFEMQQEKESLEKLINGYTQAKSTFSKTEIDLEEWNKDLNHLQKEHENYSKLVMLVNEKENSHKKLIWYQTNYPANKGNEIIRVPFF